MTAEIFAARQAALRSDNAWQDELNRLFGRNAGDVRYTKAGRGEPGSTLSMLYSDFKTAQERLRRLLDN